MRVVFADTGYWVALLNPRDELHYKATELSNSLNPCVSFKIMEQMGIYEALAYDKHFEQAGFRALLRD